MKPQKIKAQFTNSSGLWVVVAHIFVVTFCQTEINQFPTYPETA
jgi:hypothetical protein